MLNKKRPAVHNSGTLLTSWEVWLCQNVSTSSPSTSLLHPFYLHTLRFHPNMVILSCQVSGRWGVASIWSDTPLTLFQLPPAVARVSARRRGHQYSSRSEEPAGTSRTAGQPVNRQDEHPEWIPRTLCIFQRSRVPFSREHPGAQGVADSS